MIVGAVVLQVIGVFVIRKIVDIQDLMAGEAPCRSAVAAVVRGLRLGGADGRVAAVLRGHVEHAGAAGIRKLSQRGESVLAQLNLTELPGPWVKRFQQMVPRSPKDMTRLRRRACDRRLPQPDRGRSSTARPRR